MTAKAAAGGRRIAFDVLRRVTEGGAWAGLTLDGALRERPDLDSRERSLATELVYGVLRRAPALDQLIAGLSSRPLSQVDPAALLLLRMGAYQLIHMRIPDHAAVSETVALAPEVGVGGARGFVNAVLRRITRSGVPPAPSLEEDAQSNLLLTEALPPWIFDELARQLPVDEVRDLARAWNQPAPTTLRAASPEHRAESLEKLVGLGVEASPSPVSPVGIVLAHGGIHPSRIPGWRELGLQPQDEGAQLVTLFGLLDGREGKERHLPIRRALDACAAPGGKTAQLAQTLPQAKIVAVDLHRRRVERIEEEAERLGLTSRIEARAADATRPLPFAEPDSFDLILVDAPCTGLGTLRRHPEIKLTRTPEDVARLAELQLRLLRSVADYLSPGGRLVYAVCTVSRAEGPEVVEKILKERPDLEPDPPGTDSEKEGPRWADLVDAGGSLRLWTHRHGTDCFFASRLRRRPPRA